MAYVEYARCPNRPDAYCIKTTCTACAYVRGISDFNDLMEHSIRGRAWYTTHTDELPWQLLMRHYLPRPDPIGITKDTFARLAVPHRFGLRLCDAFLREYINSMDDPALRALNQVEVYDRVYFTEHIPNQLHPEFTQDSMRCSDLVEEGMKIIHSDIENGYRIKSVSFSWKEFRVEMYNKEKREKNVFAISFAKFCCGTPSRILYPYSVALQQLVDRLNSLNESKQRKKTRRSIIRFREQKRQENGHSGIVARIQQRKK